MFNLLVSGSEWSGRSGTMLGARIFEFTDDEIVARFQPDNEPDFDALVTLPSLFLQETSYNNDPLGRVGTINRARWTGRDISLEYHLDPDIPPIRNSQLKVLAAELNIVPSEFTRTHWAVKDADLFRVLIRHTQPRRPRPRVFQLSDQEDVDPTLVSVMMPFHPSFDGVYTAIQAAAGGANLRCHRADDFWENTAIIQDVVELIDRSGVVICDCTDRNPNVFYELGIAHTLGREVILITQSEADIPFDVSHLRYVTYLNNNEGRESLREILEQRLINLVGV